MYKIPSSRWMQIRRQVCVHTQLNLLMKRKNAATVAIHITANDEQRTGVQRQKSRMTRLNSESDSIISRTVVFKKGRIGTCTWSHPDRIQKSEKTKRSNIRGLILRMDLAHGRNGKETSLDIAQDLHLVRPTRQKKQH